MNTMLRFPFSVPTCIFPLLSSSPSSSSSTSSSGFISGSRKNFISLKNGISSGDFNFLGRRTRHFSAMSASNDHIGYPQDCSFRLLMDMESILWRNFFVEFGYVQREELRFPSKKLKAFWFSPPKVPRIADGGSGVNGPLPRIIISELLVDEMSPEAQLARESEYAAWTLVNGYTLNHVTVSAHRLKSHLRNIRDLNIQPRRLLLQSSTVADSTSFQFAQGIVESIPCSYIEFSERLVLPQFKNLPEDKVEEFHRRDGFEVGNADKIFESTSKDQFTRKLA
ncbi:hypothetical protein OROGR_001399 [Orobanche gracilis]